MEEYVKVNLKNYEEVIKRGEKTRLMEEFIFKNLEYNNIYDCLELDKEVFALFLKIFYPMRYAELLKQKKEEE